MVVRPVTVPIQVVGSRIVAYVVVGYGMGPNNLGIFAIAPKVKIIRSKFPCRLHPSLGVIDHELLAGLYFLSTSLAFDLGASLTNQHPGGSILIDLDSVEPTFLELDRGNRSLYQEAIRTSEPYDQISLVNLKAGSAI